MPDPIVITITAPEGVQVDRFLVNPLQAQNDALTQQNTTLLGQVTTLQGKIDAMVAKAQEAKARDAANVEGQEIIDIANG